MTLPGPVLITTLLVLAVRPDAGDPGPPDRPGQPIPPDPVPSGLHSPRTDNLERVPPARSYARVTHPDSLAEAEGLLDNQAVQLPAAWQAMLVKRDSAWVRALRLHYGAIVFDGHIDSPTRMLEDSLDFRRLNTISEAHVDLPRMVAGGLV